MFADKVGQSVLPFIVRPGRFDSVPFAALGMMPVKLSDMVPQPGEMWVLFCFRDSFREAIPPDSPLRTDGFPLVLEWRKGEGDSHLLSGAFHDLAERVRRQVGERGGGWGLHPAFGRYGDRTAFVDAVFFSDAENSLQLASAWGALAAGLLCRIDGEFPPTWTFPSIQWDWDCEKALGVAGIARKLSVAADCGADTVTIAADQRKGAAKALRELKSGPDGRRFRDLRLYVVKDASDSVAVAADIAWGPSRKRRRGRLLSAVAILLLLAVVGLFSWQSREKDAAVRRQQVDDLRITSMPRDLQDGDVEFAFDDFEVLKSAADLPEAQSALVRQLALRNWLVPIGVRPCEDSPTDFTNSCLRCDESAVSLNGRMVQCNMLWVPFDFPVLYVCDGATLVAMDAKSRDVLWESSFESDSQTRKLAGNAVNLVETWRVNPSGLVGVAEVSTVFNSCQGGGEAFKLEVAERRLVAKDPFSGKDLWRRDASAEMSAFSFSGNGRRFAYALSDGCVFMRECDTGALVALPKRFGNAVRALAFSDDDSVLHVQTGGKDVSLAVVYQSPMDGEDGLSSLGEYDDPEDMRRLCSLLADVGVPDEATIADCGRCGGHVGAFMRHSLKRPADRTVNFLSGLSISNKVETLLEDTGDIEKSRDNCRKALDLLPDACRPLTKCWMTAVSKIARENFARKWNCQLGDRRLTQIDFEDDPQATWHGEFVLRYALQQHPFDDGTRGKVDGIFLKKTGRKSLAPLGKRPAAQTETDEAIAKRQRDRAHIAALRNKAKEVQEELAFTRARNDVRHAPREGDDVIELWGKMCRLMVSGTEEGSIRCLEAYAAAVASVDEEGERRLFVPAVRQFIQERRGRNVNGGFVVMRYAPPATSHATFHIGDIVVAVNGVRDVSVADYIRMKKETNENCVLDILRYDAASETFKKLKVPLAKGQCPVMLRDLALPSGDDGES